MNVLKRLAFVIVPFSISAAIYVSEDGIDREVQHPFDEIPSFELPSNTSETADVTPPTSTPVSSSRQEQNLSHAQCFQHGINYRKLTYQRYTAARQAYSGGKEQDRVPYFIWLNNAIDERVYDPFWEQLLGWASHYIRYASYRVAHRNHAIDDSILLPNAAFIAIKSKRYIDLLAILDASPSLVNASIDDVDLLSFILLADPDISLQDVVSLLDAGVIPSLLSLRIFGERHQFQYADVAMLYDKNDVHLSSWLFTRGRPKLFKNNLLSVALMQHDSKQVAYWYQKQVPLHIVDSQYSALDLLPVPQDKQQETLYSDIASELISQGFSPDFYLQTDLLMSWLPESLGGYLRDNSQQKLNELNAVQAKPLEREIARVNALGLQLKSVPVQECAQYENLQGLFTLKYSVERFKSAQDWVESVFAKVEGSDSLDYQFLYPEGDATTLGEYTFREGFSSYRIEQQTIDRLKEGAMVPDNALLFTLKNASFYAVEQLEDFNINWQEEDEQGRNAIHYAVKRNFPTEVLELLFKKGVDIEGDHLVLLDLIQRDSVSTKMLLNRSKLLRKHGAAMTTKHLLALYERDDIFRNGFDEVLRFYYAELLAQEDQEPAIVAWSHSQAGKNLMMPR